MRYTMNHNKAITIISSQQLVSVDHSSNSAISRPSLQCVFFFSQYVTEREQRCN